MSIMFNEICINEEMLPKYTYIYMYIYIYRERENDRERERGVNISDETKKNISLQSFNF